MISTSAPPNFRKTIDVVGCFVQHNGAFLLLHRQPHKSHGGTWGMPAGKVDDGETTEQAMVREVYEETGITIAKHDMHHFESVYVHGDDSDDFMYHMFFVELVDQPSVIISPPEHQDFAWVSPETARTMSLIHDLDACIEMFYRQQ